MALRIGDLSHVQMNTLSALEHLDHGLEIGDLSHVCTLYMYHILAADR